MRILNALRADMKFQFKQGFYFVYVFLTILYMIIIRQIPADYNSLAVPIVIFSDPSFIGFFFIGGIVMLEKVQGILQYLVVTPLRPREYLISKIISLGLVAEAAGFAIAFVTFIGDFNWIVLFIGIFLTSTFFTLYGFLVAGNCNSINQYFIKMIPYMLVIVFPTLLYIPYPDVWIINMLPSIAGFNLVYGAFNGISLAVLLGNTAYLVVFNLLMLMVVEKYFTKKIVGGV